MRYDENPAKILDDIPFPPPEDWGFVEDLKKEVPFHFHWTRKSPRAEEADLSGGFTVHFHEKECYDRLETAFADLERFRREAHLGEGEYILDFAFGKVEGKYDSFMLDVQDKICYITASGPEGFRRAVYYLEDLLLGAGGPFLPKGVIRRRCFIKNRITRCFFGPIKRPPMNRDELMDDVDYYPEAYLNRLAHDGSNALWLTIEFKDLCKNSFAPHYGADAEKRLAKLRRTVEKCLRYGIRIFLFCIEPASWKANDPVAEKYKDMLGPGRTSCPCSEMYRTYIKECTSFIFRNVPGLGGMINVSLGERPTTCVSMLSSFPSPGEQVLTHPCQAQCGLSPAEILKLSVSAMVEGMREGNPEGDFIEMLYIPCAWAHYDWVMTLSENLPPGVTLLYNFESGMIRDQQGHRCAGGDYWLSAVGPAPRFEIMAQRCDPAGSMGAKLQVGCSHECATVPFVPVPSLLYRKYGRMRLMGNVNTVMQCWYFGSYPSIQSRAAGMLAFEDFSTDETEFLIRLARIEWGYEHAPFLAECWKKFAEGYSNYPFSNRIQYYGPYHDGPVWPLYPFEQFRNVYPSWQAKFPVSGDYLGEIIAPFTIDEIAAQAQMVSSQWHEGFLKLKELTCVFQNEKERLEDIAVAEVLDILFHSAANIFSFYAERNSANAFSGKMKEIMQEEIAQSERLASLCELDSRLGFHSEAETYKFFPEKLRARASLLRKFLTDPPPAYPGVDLPPCKENTLYHSKTFSWQYSFSGKTLLLKAHFAGNEQTDHVFINLAGNTMGRSLNFDIWKNGGAFVNEYMEEMVDFEKKFHADSWEITLFIPASRIPDTGNGPLHLSVIRYLEDGKQVEKFPDYEGKPQYRLCLGVNDGHYMAALEMNKNSAG